MLSVSCITGLAGLAIFFALSVTQSLYLTVRMASDLESQMVSVDVVDSVLVLCLQASFKRFVMI